jgi:hypothetical protein
MQALRCCEMWQGLNPAGCSNIRLQESFLFPAYTILASCFLHLAARLGLVRIKVEGGWRAPSESASNGKMSWIGRNPKKALGSLANAFKLGTEERALASSRNDPQTHF